MLSQRKLAILGSEVVNVDRSVRRLGGDIFVQRIPGHALNIMIVFCNLTNHLAWDNESVLKVHGFNIHTCLSIVYACNVVHAANDEEDCVGGPGKVVDF